MAHIPCGNCINELCADSARSPNCQGDLSAKKRFGKVLLLILVSFGALLTFKSWAAESADKPVLSPFRDGVTFSIQFHDTGDMKPAIIGYTNLPDGTQTTVSLSRKKVGYFAESQAVVHDGRIQTESFSVRGTALPPGTYRVEISTPIAELQPASVREIIGNHGERLTGKWTKTEFGAKLVSYSADLELGKGESIQADSAAIETKKQAEQEELEKKLELIPAAQLACEEFVKKQLHDPDSAEFDDHRSYPAEYEKKSGVYKVQVHLRARNGFDALRKGVFECKTMPVSEGKWIPVKLRQLNN